MVVVKHLEQRQAIINRRARDEALKTVADAIRTPAKDADPEKRRGRRRGEPVAPRSAVATNRRDETPATVVHARLGARLSGDLSPRCERSNGSGDLCLVWWVPRR